MLNRHELPPLLPLKNVQTSALDIQPDPDISGMIVSKRLVAHSVRLLYRTDYVTVMAPASATRDECLEIYYKAQQPKGKTAQEILGRDPAKPLAYKPREVLDTTDPLPLNDFGPIGTLTLAVPLALLATAIGWGIVKGIIGLISWIKIGIQILPVGFLP
jgi:hypothetical protein